MDSLSILIQHKTNSLLQHISNVSKTRRTNNLSSLRVPRTASGFNLNQAFPLHPLPTNLYGTIISGIQYRVLITSCTCINETYLWLSSPIIKNLSLVSSASKYIILDECLQQYNLYIQIDVINKSLQTYNKDEYYCNFINHNNFVL